MQSDPRGNIAVFLPAGADGRPEGLAAKRTDFCGVSAVARAGS
jgi:hypothetical protein